MNTTSACTLSLLVALFAPAAVGCAASSGEDGATSTSAIVSTTTDCYDNVTPGTDNPGAEADSLCVITAELGAKLRGEASASSEDLLASVGWGGLPCGYQLHVDLRDARAAMLGDTANACSVWSYGTALVNGEKTSGFVNASLLKCRRADETNEEFAARFAPACTNFSNGSGLSQSQPETCEPEAGWSKAASHDGITLRDGSGSDSALVTTSSRSRVAAIFKAYRSNAHGETEYVGCFKTRPSGLYAGHVSATYALRTTEGFYEYEAGVKRFATWADVEYYVVEGTAAIR